MKANWRAMLRQIVNGEWSHDPSSCQKKKLGHHSWLVPLSPVLSILLLHSLTPTAPLQATISSLTPFLMHSLCCHHTVLSQLQMWACHCLLWLLHIPHCTQNKVKATHYLAPVHLPLALASPTPSYPSPNALFFNHIGLSIVVNIRIRII